MRRTGASACSSATRAVFCGGESVTFSSNPVNVIDYITIATTGNAIDFGDLGNRSRQQSACTDKIKGLFCGGQKFNGVTLISDNSIWYVNITTTANANYFGDLTNTVNTAAGTSNAHGGL
ncbi:hypothetical protein CCP1ISM_5150001 [Azospirillaceae bacterium]